uniref:ribonuclease H n=1 Tax=Leptobrachium leishanense TaxID=445787 RepID=A0A8C5PUW8_9ANUR
MEEMYDDPFRENTAQTALRSLRQGRRAAEEYVTEFRRWASETTWNDSALVDQFRFGLNDTLKDEFARIGLPSTLDQLIHQSIQIDRRARERQRERASHQTEMPRVAMRPLRTLPPIPTQLALPAPPEEPMQLGASRRLHPEELQRRRENLLCLYCGRPGHQCRACPIRPVGGRGKHASHCIYKLTPDPFHTPISHLSLSVCLQWGEKTVELLAMVDSGASNCFMDFQVAINHGVPLIEKINPISIHVVDGSFLKSGPVTQETAVLSMSVGTLHIEQIQFDLVPTPMFPLILGLPWLRLHNPTIDWETGKFIFSSTTCRKTCLQPSTGVLFSILDKNMIPMNNTSLPAVYQQYADVFNEKEAEKLPPHRPYDCPIELLTGAPIPYGHIYPLSEPELRVLQEYIQENLKKGFIQPSTSPAGAGIFFIEKKDGGLRPCVDYRELNRVTVKNRYPLPLIPELMERMQTATIFTKLDLKGAYNLIRIRKDDEWKTAFRTRYGHYEYRVMPYGLCNAPATFQCFINDIFKDLLDKYVVVYLDDILVYSSSLKEHRLHVQTVLSRLRQHHLYAKLEKCVFESTCIEFLGHILTPGHIGMDKKKVEAVANWPVPKSVKEVQRFLGFANYYRKFIRDFSQTVAPLTDLTKHHNIFTWTAVTERAFQEIKHKFCSAPILSIPDPKKSFVLEVDASNTATGAILSQRQEEDDRLHPVSFLSRKLQAAERNYDVGERELLAIKHALDEWRHLLEGTLYPITIYTDHKNLEYLRTAKRLKP